jgi:hypothetical protein
MTIDEISRIVTQSHAGAKLEDGRLELLKPLERLEHLTLLIAYSPALP